MTYIILIYATVTAITTTITTDTTFDFCLTSIFFCELFRIAATELHAGHIPFMLPKRKHQNYE